MLSVRKRSDSNKCFLRESEATATNAFCATATKRAQAERKSTTRYGDEPMLMNWKNILLGIKFVNMHKNL
ncbi:hypothetical protein [Lysinibacillus sp. RS5]|uniref:hypothetical protein n=1 Tax=unclassified Lysinibacillus TaxID=2636778 RepID=UPI0035BE5DAD